MNIFLSGSLFSRLWPIFVVILLATFSFYACSSGGSSGTTVSDADGDGYTVEQGDCNDANAGISPGATEVCGDSIDQDCSGADLACTTGDVNTALLAAAATWMYQIQGLDVDGAVDILAASDYPLLVLEPGHNFTDSVYDTASIVAALNQTPDNQPRLLVAYIDIGQAEDYRDYWGADWVAPTADLPGTPDFLITIDPDGWSGNYPVAFWRQEWKDIWLGDTGIIATLAEFGFDGIYLDWVEAYDDEKVMAAATTEGVDPQLEMILFIEEMRAAGRAIDPDFLVIPQNAPYLIDAAPARYVATIDALAVEDTWFHGDGDAEWDDPRAGDLQERHDDEWSTANRLLQYQEYTSRGLPVFTVDYCISTTNATQVYTDSTAAGFIPLVTRVSLSQMTVTPPSTTPDPDPDPDPDPANTFYVAPTGDDSNPGSLAAPWKTIQKAANTLTAGQTVYIRAGTYSQQVTPQNSGTAGQVITYAAYSGETPVLDGTEVVFEDFTGLFHISNKNYITVSGLTVRDAGDFAARAADAINYNGIMVDEGSSNITIQNNWTYNTVSSGISAWDSNNIVIHNNDVELACNDGEQECITVATTDTFTVSNNTVHGKTPATNGGEGIDLKDGSSNGSVYGNHVYDLNRLGIYIEAWDKHTHDITVYANLIHDINGADGITLSNEMGGLLEDVKVYNNVVYNTGCSGISVTPNNDDPIVPLHPFKDLEIINNTFYNNGSTTCYGTDTWGGCVTVDSKDLTNLIIRNNICSQNLVYQIYIDSVVPANEVTVDYNLIDGFRGDLSEEIQGNNSVSGSPLFVNVTAGSEDFHLQATSPAIDQGTATGAPTDDYSGTARPVGQGIDIGAYEYSP